MNNLTNLNRGSYLLLGLVIFIGCLLTSAQKVSAQPYSISDNKTKNFKTSPQEDNEAKASPQLHFVKMHLSGSGCLSCLAEMERKVRLTKGVEKFEVYYPGQNSFQYYSPPDPSWSSAEIKYDSNSLSLDSLLQLIKSQGYTPYKIVDKPL